VTRGLRRLLILVVLLGAVLLALDIGAKIAVERVSARELRNASSINAGSVSTSVDTFPFLGRLLVNGETSFSVVLEEVEDQGIVVDRMEFEVAGLVFDRGEALDRRVRITEVDQVTATVVFDEQTISDAVGVPVDIEPGSATASGVTVSAVVVDRTVQVAADGVGSASFSIPSTSYLPCAPTLILAKDQVELSCTTDTLPPAINQALGQATP
jgi:hypothetical protein